MTEETFINRLKYRQTKRYAPGGENLKVHRETCMNFVLLLDGEKVLASTPNLPQPPEEILKGLKNINDDLKRGLKNPDKALGFQVEAPEGTRIVKLHSSPKRGVR